VQLVAHVVSDPEVGVLRTGHAPADEENVEALAEQELHERVPRAQVEDLGPVDEGEDEQDRDGVPPVLAAVAVERRLAVRPDDIARARPDDVASSSPKTLLPARDSSAEAARVSAAT
jgi:hypothetical protein